MRRGVTVNHADLINKLITIVEERSGLPLLRVYWYDAARNGIGEPEHERIGLLPRVKLRLGRIGVDGEQKGVDLRIGLDMVSHARNGAIDALYLLSGDDDLTEAVEEAQAQGVQVIVLAAPNTDGSTHGVSRHLIRAADGVELIPTETLNSTVHSVAATEPTATAPEPTNARIPNPADLARRTPTTTLVPVYTGSGGAAPYIAPEYRRDDDEINPLIDDVVKRAYDAWATTATPAQKSELIDGQPSIPRDLDRALLVDLSAALGDYNLSDRTRVALRSRFWDAVPEVTP
nr:NYN domain-containing protein [Leifsonia aquatica]